MQAKPDPLYISRKQLAKLLDVSLRTISRIETEEGIPGRIRLGRKLILYRYAEVIAWIDAHEEQKASHLFAVGRGDARPSLGRITT